MPDNSSRAMNVGSVDSQQRRIHRPQPPALSAEQRAVAFHRSLELRRDRAGLKRAITAHPDLFPGLMLSAPAQGMKVLDLLMALPGIGKARALKLLEQAGIPEKNTVRACGARQTEALLALLGK